jgi:hypothetical protein
MVPSNKPKPGWLFAPCAAAFALSIALPAFADDEQREDKTEPFAIEFDNPCTPDHLSGQGQQRTESRTTTKNGKTEIRERRRVTGRPLGTPSLAIYDFSDDDATVTRSSATTFKFTEHRRIQGVPDRQAGANLQPVAAFFITNHTEVISNPHQSKSRQEQDTKCRDRQGRDRDPG